MRHCRITSPAPSTTGWWRRQHLAKVLHEAFYVASTGRPGPVVVDVPKTCSSMGSLSTAAQSDVHVSYTRGVKGDARRFRKAVAAARLR